ncbi:glycosyltransferase family 4 protein [Methylicorpusculum oleiharenae]|uniref:glycosyltransferase family 4 protein n=1 Tax=Methylicorpusculum oleiharenae TaxID=1338687 RepID=UPI00135A0C82|nr:glycosyltransferase family 4 protein [Methylicorpusculum oleiharenae]MCD2451821.1 glycosyltransferase family 4 protein [Methylicorpusculum oleiharenae]
MPPLPAQKRILYVENGIGYGGAIICLRHLIRNLDRSKFTPMVVTGKTGAHYKEIAQEALWRHIPDRYVNVVGANRKFDHIKWLNKIPGLRVAIDQILARTDDIANFLPFFIRLLWTAWRFKADLIHANNEPLCNRAALIVGKVLKIPTVCHVRGDQDGSHLMKWTYTLPNHFISVSHWVAKSMSNKLQVPAEKIDVIYDGIELEKLNFNANPHEFRKIFNIDENDFSVGLIGLLIPWKGQEIFLDAAKTLRDKIPNLKMMIIGGTPDECKPYEIALRKRVINERLENIIILTGHLSQMEPVYNGLDVVVSASTSPEPLGTMVIECMAMGRPLIGPNHGGAAEMMEHNKTGLLFTPQDALSLAAEIEKYYQSKELRLTMGRNARAHALKTFSVETHANKIQVLYERMLY